MKVAVIAGSRIPSFTANSIQTMKVCQALTQAGHQVCLWVPGERTEDRAALASLYGVDIRFEICWLGAPLLLKRYDFSLRAVLQAKAWGADVIYTWMSPAAVLALENGLPSLLEVHDRPSGRLGPWWLRRFLLSKGKKRLLPITQALLNRLEADIGIHLPADEVMIAPMGTEPERYQNLPDPSSARRQLELPERLTVGYTGHLYPGRGMDLLVELARTFPQAQFLWVGGHPRDVEYWRKHLVDEKIDNVILTGFVDNRLIPLYQAAAEVLLMPYERAVQVSGGGNTADFCSPMKMFDYLSSGKAIISSDLPVLREVLNPTNAVLCPPQDVEAWSAALQLLINDPVYRTRLGEQAKLDAQKYTWLERARISLQGLGKF
jgi:glycosyltransferase involved in cell wall biosynthesis